MYLHEAMKTGKEFKRKNGSTMYWSAELFKKDNILLNLDDAIADDWEIRNDQHTWYCVFAENINGDIYPIQTKYSGGSASMYNFLKKLADQRLDCKITIEVL